MKTLLWLTLLGYQQQQQIKLESQTIKDQAQITQEKSIAAAKKVDMLVKTEKVVVSSKTEKIELVTKTEKVTTVKPVRTQVHKTAHRAAKK